MDKPFHILIVEDTPIAQIIVKTHMEKHGCLVDLALDSDTAISKASHMTYDLILMDIGLGEGPDGFETTSIIKQKSSLNTNTPVMAVTAHDEPEYNVRAKEVGMVGYFSKPFQADDAKKIMHHLNQRAA